MTDQALRDGASNLLVRCAGMRAGQTLLVIVEDPATGYYDPALAAAVMATAGDLGIRAVRRQVPFTPEPAAPPAELLAAMAAADRTLFLARLGDQLRFKSAMADIRPVVCYALDPAMLASGFGRANHQAFVALKSSLDSALAAARQIRVTCPLGTDFEGPGAEFPPEGTEVTVARFPLSVFSPVPASGFRGRVVQAGFLTGTGARYYRPYSIALDGLLSVHFEGNRITRFEGAAADCARAEAHYRDVAVRYGLLHDFIHSWHAGIHPGCAYPEHAALSPERWSGSAFGNPRLLHFHTCGEEPPGEISLNVVDPTIRLDGIAVWEDGRLRPERVPGGAAAFARCPEVAALFANPAREIGLGSDGRLSGRAAR